MKPIPELKNAQAVDLEDIPVFNIEQFKQQILSHVQANCRVSVLFGIPGPNVRLYCILADDAQHLLLPFATDVGQEYPSLTPECPQVHLFEREIWEQCNVTPIGHPWLKPVRFPRKAGNTSKTKPMIGITNYFQVQGEEVHEVGVGPVHAGVIEPGHFRFQCHGENVYHLEISLGYQHRGIEKKLIGGPYPRTLLQMEAVAGDTSIGHGLAYCQILETLANLEVSARSHTIRAIALELERLANHTGDLGALAGDVAFLPTSAACGALRGDYLNISAVLCGSRLGRGLIKPGGVYFDLDAQRIQEMRKRLDKAFAGTKRTSEILFDAPSVLSRFENTGRLAASTAVEIGLVGSAARACGLKRDIRQDHPIGWFIGQNIPIALCESGDVLARARMRWLEIRNSVALIQTQLNQLPEGNITAPKITHLAGNKLVASLSEGWRGEICHVAITNSEGTFAHYKIVDPSFHNWFGLALALRGQAIFDFPLCNKSFNLSYCGFDL